jgi:hypothetical protein
VRFINYLNEVIMGTKSLNLRGNIGRGGMMYMTNRDKIKFNNQYKFAPENTVLPVVTGIGTVGQVLTTDDGTWIGEGVIAYTYQWYADLVEIGGATNNTYTILIGDSGKDITCIVTATDINGSRPRRGNAISVA